MIRYYFLLQGSESGVVFMSKLIILCKECGTEREVDEKLAGTVVMCSNCKTSIRIPLPDIGEGSLIGGGCAAAAFC